MKNKPFFVLLKNQFKRLFSDALSSALIIVGPCIMAIAAIAICSYAMNNDRKYDINIFYDSEYADVITDHVNKKAYDVNLFCGYQGRTEDKDIDIIVGSEIEIIYDSSAMVNAEGINLAQDIAYEISILLNASLEDFESLNIKTTAKEDICKGKDLLASKTGYLYSMVFFFTILGFDVFFSNEMHDTITLSARRGETDTLKMTGVSSGVIGASKVAYGYIYMAISYLSATFGIVLGLLICEFQEKNIIISEFRGNILSIVILIATLFEVGIISISFTVISAALSKGLPNANFVSFMLNLLFMIVVILPSHVPEAKLSWLPVANMWEMFLNAVNGSVDHIGFLISVILTAICVAGTFQIMPKLTERE